MFFLSHYFCLVFTLNLVMRRGDGEIMGGIEGRFRHIR